MFLIHQKEPYFTLVALFLLAAHEYCSCHYFIIENVIFLLHLSTTANSYSPPPHGSEDSNSVEQKLMYKYIFIQEVKKAV